MTISKHLTPIIFKRKSTLDKKPSFDYSTDSNSDDDEASNVSKVRILRKKCYKEQALWFLNSLPSEMLKNIDLCEEVWKAHKTCSSLDKDSERGCMLDEFSAHRLLESCDDACTVRELRNFLITIDPDRTMGKFSLLEFLIYKYDVDWREVVNAEQCFDWQAQKEAQQSFDRAKCALDITVDAMRNAKKEAQMLESAEIKAANEEDNASKAAEISRLAEIELSQAKEEAALTLSELKKQEDLIREKKTGLKTRASDDTLGVVKRNKAKAELAILFSEDPLPLRRARISEEHAIKKCTKASIAAKVATGNAELAIIQSKEAKHCAATAKLECLEAAKIAEQSIPIMEDAFEEVQEILGEVSKNKKAGKGILFYIDRELIEAKKFLPKNKFVELEAEADEMKQLATPENDIKTAYSKVERPLTYNKI